MTKLARRRALVPDVFDWTENFLPFAGNWRSPLDVQRIRIEDSRTDGQYVVRAELPGVDPDKDVEISVQDNTLTLMAQRSEETTEKSHSEFRYGSFRRTIPLPVGAKPDDIKAKYADGILTISVPVPETPPAEKDKKIQIERA